MSTANREFPQTNIKNKIYIINYLDKKFDKNHKNYVRCNKINKKELLVLTFIFWKGWVINLSNIIDNSANDLVML